MGGDPEAESEEDRRYARRLALATDPDARVMVFCDGQYLYKACGRAFRHSQCHPDALARQLAGPRKLTGTRFYTGQHDPRKYPDDHAAMERRLQGMNKRGVDFHTRTLQYVWEWGPTREAMRSLPPAGPLGAPVELQLRPYERAMEKGIDLFLALDAIDLALRGAFDVAIVLSLDRDLAELPPMLRQMVRRLRLPEVRVEAAIVAMPSPKRPKKSLRVLPGYDYTHQITEEMFRDAIDTTNYRVTQGAAVPEPLRLPLKDQSSDA